ncbi:inositol monophosphatase [bacterium DOLJORAL78_65_58]|nr:MAG: inositol monophosphatase [bacterium DOLZORAL124_64_63]PIE75979.1 MAG: inositol monophosphatase [bacterium DOLJORAL78_65_58]
MPSPTPDTDLQAQLATVRNLALEAGRILLADFDQVGTISRKRATELVTDLDGRVEAMLLQALQRHFPADRVLAEETGEHGGRSGRTWYIDPLDGTTNYAHGLPTFAVSMACGDAEGLLLGCVYAPYLDELYLATRGGGARLERPAHATDRDLDRDLGRDLGVTRPAALEDALLATGFPYERDHKVDLATGLVNTFLKRRCHGVRRAGSAAVDLAHVAAGKLDGYWELHLRPWDTAAGTLVAREAGALVTTFGGEDVALPHQSIVAASPALHAQMLKIITPAWREVGP